MNDGLPAFPRTLILGLGLLGGSLALALRKAGLASRLLGFDTDSAHQSLALELGLVDALWDSTAEPKPFDLVFVAVPPGQVGAVLADLGPWLHANTLVMDACSVKAPVAQAMASALGPHAGLLPAHPIAGGHTAGPASAQADLFAGCTVVLTPLSCTASATVRLGHALWGALGARVVEMAPDEHDRQLGLLSHLSHLLAYTTVSLAADQGVDFTLVGPGFRDATRLAQCPAPLWADIALSNRDVLGPVLRAFAGRLGDLARALEDGDRAALQQQLGKARELRARL